MTKQIIAFCFAEGLKEHKFWELEILPSSDETMGRHPLKWPVQWVQLLKTVVHFSRKWTRDSPPFRLRTGSHSLSEILCSFTNRRSCIQTINQDVLNFAYCRQNPLELSDISGVYSIHTFSVWNVRKRNVENTRCEIKIGLTLENGQLPSRPAIYEM